MYYLWLLIVFALGVGVGGIVNYCFFRLPLEKSILWPGPRCAHCLQPIRWFDNLPLVSFFVLRGRCRSCGGRISLRYPIVELLTGLIFAGLFHAEFGRNILDLEYLRIRQADITAGHIPAAAWAVFGCHALLVSFLLLTSLCDLDDMAIPLPITITGTLIGLTCSMLFPWPFPNVLNVAPSVNALVPPRLDAGLYPWPVWYPLPKWLPAGSWQLGLATGLAGAAAGIMAMRVIRFTFGLTRGVEALGLGDADLMMMAGSFVGWQPVLISCLVAALPGLFFAFVQLARRGNHPLPFGPALSLGVLMTLWLWPYFGDSDGLRLLFFVPGILGALAGGAAFFLLLAGLVCRFLLGSPRSEPEG